MRWSLAAQIQAQNVDVMYIESVSSFYWDLGYPERSERGLGKALQRQRTSGISGGDGSQRHRVMDATDSKKRHLKPASSSPPTGNRPRKTARLDTTMPSVSDERQAKMDRLILDNKWIRTMRRPLDSEDGGLILSQIVHHAGDPLNQTYTNPNNAQSLIENDSSLLKELEDALEKKEFAQIRSLSE